MDHMIVFSINENFTRLLGFVFIVLLGDYIGSEVKNLMQVVYAGVTMFVLSIFQFYVGLLFADYAGWIVVNPFYGFLGYFALAIACFSYVSITESKIKNKKGEKNGQSKQS